MARRSLRAGTTVVVAAAVLSACSVAGDDAGSARDEPELGAISVVESYDDIALPLDAYRLVGDDSLQVTKAYDVLLNECMTELGFADRALPDRPARADGGPLYGRRYGILRMEDAERYGYHPATSSVAGEAIVGPRQDEDPASDPWSTDAAQQALGEMDTDAPLGETGDQPGESGCVYEAHNSLASGEDAFYPQLAENLAHQAWLLQESDSRVEHANAAWSECMAAAGFEYDRPSDANNDEQWDANPSSDAEIATAVADIGCKLETNLTGIRMAVETAYQNQLIEENAEALDTTLEGNSQMLRNAAEVLADSGAADASG